MSLAFHHFKKECRYLWPRWLVFLAALTIDYAIQMEWLWPMETARRDSYVGLLPSVAWSFHVWAAAWWLMLCVPKEDALGASLDIRPLPRTSYWAARLLVWLLFVVVPLLVQNALVLASLGRPWGDVMTGMMERGLTAFAMILWVLPAATLFSSWEKYVGILLFVFVLVSLGIAFTEWLSINTGLSLRHSWTTLYDSSLTVSAAWLLGPLVLALAWWHQRRPLARWQRLVLPVLLSMAVIFVSRLPTLPSPHEKAHDQAFVDTWKDKTPILETEDIRLSSNLAMQRIGLSGIPTFRDLPDDVVATFRPTRRTITQGATELSDLNTPSPSQWLHPSNDGIYDPWWISYGPLAKLFPSATLHVGAPPQLGPSLSVLPASTGPKQPMTLDLDLTPHFSRVQLLGKVAVHEGARFSTPKAELEIIKVLVGEDERGWKSPGLLHLKIRQRTSSLEADGRAAIPKQAFILHAPGKALIWSQYSAEMGVERGANHGWRTSVTSVSFSNVLTKGTEIKPEDLAKQELAWVESVYLGSTTCSLKIDDLRLDDLSGTNDPWPGSGDVLSRQGQRPTFTDYIRNLPKPSDDLASAKHYLAASCNGALAYPNRNGADDAEADIIAPVLVKHPELITLLGDGLWVHTPKLTSALLRAALRLVKAPETHLPLDVGDWPRTSTAVIEAIRGDVTKLTLLNSKDPERDWQMLPRRITRSRFTVLMRTPEYRERASAEITRQYERVPRQTYLTEDQARILGAKAALGDAEALNRSLRSFALWTNPTSHSQFIVAVFRVIALDVKHDTAPSIDFINRCRTWTADDFIYDPEALKWTLK